VQTVLNEDTGGQYLQVHHTLVTYIRDTDDVTFELSYQSKNDPMINAKDVMVEDAGRCKIALDSTAKDKRFWTQTADDVYYKCDGDYTCSTGVKTVQ
jgi:hypothetical protein